MSINVKDSSGASLKMRSSQVNSEHRSHVISESIVNMFQDSFPGSAVSSTKWASSTGTGTTISVASGSMTITSGTTANSVAYVLSNTMFQLPVRLSVAISASQRIANNDFYIELVSVNASTGLPDGVNAVGLRFDGTTATNFKYFTTVDSVYEESAVVTSMTSASQSVVDIFAVGDETLFCNGPVNTVGSYSYVNKKQSNMPDTTAYYKIRIRSVNGATAPASSTSWTVGFVACKDYFEQHSRPFGGGAVIAAAAQPVAITNTYSTYIYGNVFFNETTSALAASGVFTGSYRDVGRNSASAGLHSFFNAFANASHAGTFTIEGSNDATTWYTVATTSLVAGVPSVLNVPVLTRYHRVKVTNGATAQTSLFVNSAYTVA